MITGELVEIPPSGVSKDSTKSSGLRIWVRSGMAEGKSKLVDERILIVGGSPDCDLFLPDPDISDAAFIIEARDEGAQVTILHDCTECIQVDNGQGFESFSDEAFVSPGARLKLASVEMVFGDQPRATIPKSDSAAEAIWDLEAIRQVESGNAGVVAITNDDALPSKPAHSVAGVSVDPLRPTQLAEKEPKVKQAAAQAADQKNTLPQIPEIPKELLDRSHRDDIFQDRDTLRTMAAVAITLFLLALIPVGFYFADRLDTDAPRPSVKDAGLESLAGNMPLTAEQMRTDRVDPSLILPAPAAAPGTGLTDEEFIHERSDRELEREALQAIFERSRKVNGLPEGLELVWLGEELVLQGSAPRNKQPLLDAVLVLLAAEQRLDYRIRNETEIQ